MDKNLKIAVAGTGYVGLSIATLFKDYDFEAHKELVPMQPGDVEMTYADVEDLIRDFNFKRTNATW